MTPLLLLPISLLLAACSGSPSPTTTMTDESIEITATLTQIPTKRIATATITPQPTSSLGVDKSDLNGLMLTFWHPWAGETGEVIQESIKEFNQINEFGITVESISRGTYNTLNMRIETVDSHSDLPNLAVGANYQILSWRDSGVQVVDLDAYVNDPEWGLSTDEQSDFSKLFLEQDISDKTRIGFPAVRSTQLMFYNTSWAKELGFSSPPSTPQEFKEQACEASQALNANDLPEDDGSGGWLINTTPSGVLSWLYAFGSQVVRPDGEGYQFNTPQTEEAMRFLKNLFDEGCAWELLESTAEVEFANRKALFITGSLSDIPYQVSELDRVNNNDDWTVIGFPSPQGEPVIDVYGPAFFIFGGTPEENLASWLLIKWLASAEQGAKFVSVHGTYPTRASAMDFLDLYASENPQWATTLELLDHAQPEPGLGSWKTVRWVLGDVGTQIFRYYFTPDRIPITLELMDETIAELHEMSP